MTGASVGVAIQLTLAVIVFAISFRRSRKYYNRSVGRAVATALPLAVFCPLGVLIMWGLTIDQTPGYRNKW